jgi:hypothetical protein
MFASLVDPCLTGTGNRLPESYQKTNLFSNLFEQFDRIIFVNWRARIAIVAVTALAGVGAIGAGTAQAVEFHTESGENTTITGNFEAKGTEGAFNFATHNGPSPCVGTSLHGVMPAKTESTLTLSVATIGECLYSTTMGGCDFVLHASGTFDIGGVGCATEPIEINRNGCKMKIGPQKGLSKVSYVNVNKGAETERDVEVTFDVTQIHYTQTRTFPCLSEGTFTDGRLVGVATFKADDPEGKQKGFWVE